MSLRGAGEIEGGLVPTGPRGWVREMQYCLGIQTVCGMGNAFPTGLLIRSMQNCRQPATIRARVADEYDWHHYCEEHSKWPWQDRSWWRHHSYHVERREGGVWVPWTDYDIYTPEASRRYSGGESE